MVNALFTPCDALRKLPRISKPSRWPPDPGTVRAALGLPPPPQRDHQLPPSSRDGALARLGALGCPAQRGAQPRSTGSQLSLPRATARCWGHRCPHGHHQVLRRELWGGPATPRALWASGPGSLARKTLNGVCCKAPIHSSPVLPKAEGETIPVASNRKKLSATHTHTNSF